MGIEIKRVARLTAMPVLVAGIAVGAAGMPPVAHAGTGYSTFRIVVDDSSAFLVQYGGTGDVAPGSIPPLSTLRGGTTGYVSARGDVTATFDAPEDRHYKVYMTSSTDSLGHDYHVGRCDAINSVCTTEGMWGLRIDAFHLGPPPPPPPPDNAPPAN